MLSVGAVWPPLTVAPLGGAVRNDARQPYSDSEVSDDDILSVGARVPMNRTAVCCARLDDFDWLVPDYVPDILLPGRDIEVGVTDLTLDIHVLPDVFPVVSARAAAVLMPLLAGAKAVPQFKIRRETIPAVSPLAEKMSSCVVTVGLTGDGSDHPAELLDSDQDCCLNGYWCDCFGVVSGRICGGSAVPTSLPTITEVFSSAVLAGGGGGSLLRQPPWPR